MQRLCMENRYGNTVGDMEIQGTRLCGCDGWAAQKRCRLLQNMQPVRCLLLLLHESACRSPPVRKGIECHSVRRQM